jgi:bla regulator protein BlaR1
MAPLCLLYFIAVSSCLGGAALLVERALPATAPRRWVWCVVLAISPVLPMYFSIHHSSPTIEIWGHEIVRLPAGHMHGTAPHQSGVPDWMDCSAPEWATLMRLWGISTALLPVWALADALRVSRAVRKSRGASGGRDARTIVDGVPVLVTESLGPATVGLWRSRVLLPRWVLALPDAQRQYVLRHEEEHRGAHDARLLFVASIVASLMPWNLPLWWQLRRLRLAVEMDCDRRVVSALGDATAYGSLLLRVAEAASRGPRLQPALLGRVGMLERRLTELVAPRPRQFAQRFLAPALAIALVLLVLSVPHPDPARHADAHETVLTSESVRRSGR